MTRTALWTSIAGTLRDEIAQGHYTPGDKLPTEAQLAARFGVNRHTVRHALSALVEEGLVLTRRGAGAFVSQKPTEYPIGRRVRYHQNLRAAGRIPGRTILHAETRLANALEIEALDLTEGDFVHVRQALSFADDQPLALGEGIFPAARLPDLHDLLDKHSSTTEALQHCGIEDYVRLSTRITAHAATATQAVHLLIREGDPVLRTVSIEATAAGVPIQYGTTWFAGDRTTLTLQDT